MKHRDDRLRSAAAPFVALVVLAVALSGHTGVSAYDVCTDDYAGRGVDSCAHEQMFDEAMRFYKDLVVPNRFSQEIIDNKAHIRAGVGAPDAGDVYQGSESTAPPSRKPRRGRRSRDSIDAAA